MSLFLDGNGRVRLGWRVAAFLASAGAVTAGVQLLVPPGGLLGPAAAQLAGALSAGWLLLRLDGRGPGALGFHLARSVPREVGGGLLLGCGVAVVVLAAQTAAGGIAWALEGGTARAWLVGAGKVGGLLAVAAAAEEALLRGYPLQALAEAWGAGWALVLTSAAFGAMHLGNPGATILGAAGTAAAGLLLGAVYLRTGSLWWATGAHLGWNWAVAYGADLPLSGLEVADAPWVAPVTRGPGWLGGGAFGPEGSVLATLGFLAAAAACWWGPWLSVEPAAAARRPLAVRGGTRADEPVSEGRRDP